MRNVENELDKLVEVIKNKSKCSLVSGILPNMRENDFQREKRVSLNNKLRQMCSLRNVKFVDLSVLFENRYELFARDGIYLNRFGKEKLGYLLKFNINNAVIELINNEKREQERHNDAISSGNIVNGNVHIQT